MLTSVLSTFGPVAKETAVFYLGAVSAFALAAFTALTSSGDRRVPGRAIFLVAVGLTLWLWPLMWNTVGFAF
jgi:hypothetical protein